MVTVADPRAGMVLLGSISKSQIASFTTTWLSVTGSGPPFRMLNANSCSVGRAKRWTLRSSMGGRSVRSTPAPFKTIKASNSPRPRSGTSPRSTQAGPRSFFPTFLLLHLEEAHPAELGELAHVGVEHEPAGEAVAELHDPALPLSEHLGVRELRRLKLRARRVVVEEVGVRVEAVDEIELQHVDHVRPHQLPKPYLYGVFLVVEGHGVDRVDLVRSVEVGVEAVHDHDHLVGLRPTLLRIYYERPVEPLLYVLPQGRGVAVVEVHPERLGVELVDELLPGTDELEHPIHVRRVETVEVDRVRVRASVLEHYPQPVPFPRPQGRPRHLAVVGPRRIHHPRRDLDLDVLRRQLVLPYGPTTLPSLLAPVEISQERRRIETRSVHVPHRAVATVGGSVLARCLRDSGAVVSPIVPPRLARVSPQERTGDPKGARSP